MQRKGVRATRSAAAGRARVLGGRILLLRLLLSLPLGVSGHYSCLVVFRLKKMFRFHRPSPSAVTGWENWSFVRILSSRAL